MPLKRLSLVLGLGMATALWAGPPPLGSRSAMDLVTNNDTRWKMFHPDLFLRPEYKGCVPFFKDLIQAGADIVFVPWPKEPKFTEAIKRAYPKEKSDFLNRFHFVDGIAPGKEPDIWTKDYVVFCEGAGRCMLLSSVDKATPPGKEKDPAYKNADVRPKERREFNHAFGRKFSIPVKASPLRFEGGNFMKAGKDKLLMTKNVYDQYHQELPEKPTTEQLEAFWKRNHERFERDFKTYLNREVVWLEPLPEEGTGHVDMFATVVGDTVLVGQLDQKYVDDAKDEEEKKWFRWTQEILDGNAEILEKKGFKVRRIPQPPPYKVPREKKEDPALAVFPSFANSLQVQDDKGKTTVFVPDPEVKGNPAQAAAMKKAMEASYRALGVEMKWVPAACNREIEKGFGSLSCVTGACPTPVRKHFEDAPKPFGKEHDD